MASSKDFLPRSVNCMFELAIVTVYMLCVWFVCVVVVDVMVSKPRKKSKVSMLYADFRAYYT
jgi:hypothetical protein